MLRASGSDVARRRRLAVWWITSLSLLAAVLLGFTTYFIVSTVRSYLPMHHVGCLPSDFPIYRSLTVLEVDQTFALPGYPQTAQCRMRLVSNDRYDSINTFYRVQLNSGSWVYTSYEEDLGGSIIQFDRRAHPSTRGSLTIHKQGGGTPLEILLIG